jgi:mxaJ protein
MPRSPDTLTRLLIAGAALGLSIGPAARAADPAPLTACAAADNMPFSNDKQQGFENKIGALIAGQLGRPISFAWMQERPDTIRTALDSGRCDFVLGVPSQFAGVETTGPYYWSSYVLVSRADRHLDVSSLKDHRVRSLKIGVASLRDNPLYSPPAQVLADAGMQKNLVAFPIEDSAPTASLAARVIEAVVNGDIDAAALWGPLAGWFVHQAPATLAMVPIGDTDQFSSRKAHLRLIGLQYEIAMGVRAGNETLRQQLDDAIAQRRTDITALLKSYGVPVIEPGWLATVTHAANDTDD